MTQRSNIKNPPICLTIAGSDPCAGAGIQADLKAFAAHGCYGMSVITATTAQSHQGIRDIHAIPADHFEAQLQHLLDCYEVSAIKTGLILGTEQIDIIVETLSKFPNIPLVIDPVLSSSSGTSWSNEAFKRGLVDSLLPRATLITPNLPEYIELFCKNANDANAQHDIFTKYLSQNNTALLLKGGHSDTTHTDITDTLHLPNEVEPVTFTHPRIPTSNDHGTGCTLASSICARLALGNTLVDATRLAINYLEQCIRHSEGFLLERSSAPFHNMPMQHFFDD